LNLLKNYHPISLYNIINFSINIIINLHEYHQYYIIEQQGILFAGRFPRDKTIKEKFILKDLEKIGKKFFERYTEEEVDNWNHNLNKFIDFHGDIKPRNDILGDFIESLWDREIEQEN